MQKLLYPIHRYLACQSAQAPFQASSSLPSLRVENVPASNHEFSPSVITVWISETNVSDVQKLLTGAYFVNWFFRYKKCQSQRTLQIDKCVALFPIHWLNIVDLDLVRSQEVQVLNEIRSENLGWTWSQRPDLRGLWNNEYSIDRRKMSSNLRPRSDCVGAVILVIFPLPL